MWPPFSTGDIICPCNNFCLEEEGEGRTVGEKGMKTHNMKTHNNAIHFGGLLGERGYFSWAAIECHEVYIRSAPCWPAEPKNF